MQETLATTMTSSSRKQRTGGRETKPLDLLVDRRILLNVGISPRDVGLGLIVIEVADEIFDGVVREKLLELAVELRSEGLVVRNHQRWLVQGGQDVGSRKGFTGTGHPKQRLVPVTRLERTGKLIDRPLLITARFELRGEFERH